MKLRASCWWILLVLFTGCHKVPLRTNQAQFDVAVSHWFENEQTQYVFYSVHGMRPEQARTTWNGGFELSKSGREQDFSPLDFSAAIYRHRLVECGDGRLCGSYSFHAEKPLTSLAMRYRYNWGSPMKESTYVHVAIHPAGPTADAHSALVYGVFNGDNSKVQIRIHDNFGTPDSSEIENFGMDRAFSIQGMQLVDMSSTDKSLALTESASPFAFPAKTCLGHSGRAEKFRVDQRSQWSPFSFDSEDPSGVACFDVQALDKNGKVLKQNPAMARRNPVLMQEPIQLHPPLREAHLIPIVLSYCPGLPESPNLTSPAFLDFQRAILGFDSAPIDACFATGEEPQFEKELERVLNQKLAQARGRFAGDGRDFFFTVIIHHNLSNLVVRFHEIISSQLSAKIASEVEGVSPRLVGAFVYDSQSTEGRSFDHGRNIVWCPSKEAPRTMSPYDADANCMFHSADELSFGPSKFLQSIGPFPSMKVFDDHVSQYQDRSRARFARFLVKSVQTNINSITNAHGETLYTFLDGQRVSLREGEQLKFCRNYDAQDTLDQLAFRQSGALGTTPLLNVDDAQNLISNKERRSPLNLAIGIKWDSAFVGGFEFETPVSGHLFQNLIPITKYSRNRKEIGDSRWQQNLDLTPLLQRCVRFCDHPFFDESGAYQISSNWSQLNLCPAPKPPEP